MGVGLVPVTLGFLVLGLLHFAVPNSWNVCPFIPLYLSVFIFKTTSSWVLPLLFSSTPMPLPLHPYFEIQFLSWKVLPPPSWASASSGFPSFQVGLLCLCFPSLPRHYPRMVNNLSSYQIPMEVEPEAIVHS